MDANRIIRSHEGMEAARMPVESIWADVARYVVPELDRFFGGHQRARQRVDYPMDTSPSVALNRCAAILTALATPHEQEYHELRVSDDRLNNLVRPQRWLSQVNQIIRRRRYGGKRNFRRPADSLYRNITAFGPGAVFLADGGEEGPRYAPMPIQNLFFETDPFGVIVKAHRRLMWTPQDIINTFDKERIPAKVLKAAEQDRTDKEELIHAIWPADRVEPGRIDIEGMPFRSYYVHRETKTILEEGGFRKWPLPVFRYQVTDVDPYGWSPAMAAMGDIKSLQSYARDNMRAAHFALDPVILTKADAVLPRNMPPGSFIPGGLDMAGNPMARPLIEGRQFQPALELQAQIRETIDNHFLVRMIQFLVDSPQMTATEVLQNAREQGILFAPTANLLYGDEALMGMIEWELDNASFNGALPPPPPELLEAFGTAAKIEVEFDSPMTRNMQADKAVGIARTYEFANGIAQYDPDALDILDHQEALRFMARYQGAPPTIVRPRDEALARQEQRNERAQQQSAVEALPQVAKAAKDLSAAEAMQQ